MKTLKLNNPEMSLYVKSMGKLFKVTAVCKTDEEATLAPRPRQAHRESRGGSMITEKALSQNRIVTVHTSDNKPADSGLKFHFNGMTVYVPMRTADLKTIQGMLVGHIRELEGK